MRSVLIRAIVSLTVASLFAAGCAAPSREAVAPSPSNSRPTETAAKTSAAPKTAAEIALTAADLPSGFKLLTEEAKCQPLLPNPAPVSCFERMFVRIPPAAGSLLLTARVLVYTSENDAAQAFARILRTDLYVPKTSTEVAVSEPIREESHVYQEASTGSGDRNFLLWIKTGPVITYVRTGNLADVLTLGRLQATRIAN